MRMLLWSFVVAATLAACTDEPGLSLRVTATLHAIAPGDTTTIALWAANTTTRPHVIDGECKPSFLVLNTAGVDVTPGGGRALICAPMPPPGIPLEPGDTLVLFYRWAGEGSIDVGGGVIATVRLPEGLYFIRGNLGSLRWPTDTVRILQ